MKMDILQKLKRYRKKIWLFFLLTVFLCGACRAAYVKCIGIMYDSGSGMRIAGPEDVKQ